MIKELNVFQAIYKLYKGDNISHFSWGDTNQVFYLKLKNKIPTMFVWGDHFRETLRGKNHQYITCNPFKIFRHWNGYIEWYKYN